MAFELASEVLGTQVGVFLFAVQQHELAFLGREGVVFVQDFQSPDGAGELDRLQHQHGSVGCHVHLEDSQVFVVAAGQ